MTTKTKTLKTHKPVPKTISLNIPYTISAADVQILGRDIIDNFECPSKAKPKSGLTQARRDLLSQVFELDLDDYWGDMFHPDALHRLVTARFAAFSKGAEGTRDLFECLLEVRDWSFGDASDNAVLKAIVEITDWAALEELVTSEKKRRDQSTMGSTKNVLAAKKLLENAGWKVIAPSK